MQHVTEFFKKVAVSLAVNMAVRVIIALAPILLLFLRNYLDLSFLKNLDSSIVIAFLAIGWTISSLISIFIFRYQRGFWIKRTLELGRMMYISQNLQDLIPQNQKNKKVLEYDYPRL